MQACRHQLLKMKKLLTKTILISGICTSFIACKKESVVAEKEETTTSVSSGPGLNEYTQRGSNGSVVIYSGWITKTQSDWTGFGTNEIITSLTAPSLSDDVVNKGVVLVYSEAGGPVAILPNVWFDAIYSYVNDFTFSKQKIVLKIRLIGSLINNVLDVRYRYVLIPGTSLTGRMRSPVDYNDYDAVCNYYGIAK